MEWYEALFFLLGMVLFFMALGMPVAIAFLAANLIGAVIVWGGRGTIDVQMSRGITTLANNGLEAMDQVEANDFDLILMDIQMPEMDGYRATAEIRRHNIPGKRNIPIIALTASAFLTEKEKAVLFGMNDHVGKPFSPAELMEKIKNCLRVHSE